MKLLKNIMAFTVAVLPVAASADVNITFETQDYQQVGVYDWWEASPFRAQDGQPAQLKGNCKVVNNPYASEEDAVNDSEKVLGFQRSIYGSNMFGARIDLKPEQRFVLTPQVQYVHVLMRKPVNGRSMMICLGRHNEKTAGYETTWKDQSPEVVQTTATSNNKAPADTWTDVVFPIKGAGNIDIYSLVVVPDCEAPHQYDKDFVVYIDNIKVNNSSAPEVALVGDYPVCFDADQKYTRSDRKLNSITIGTKGGNITKQANGTFCLTEAFDSFISVQAGETITAQCNYTGTWMHSFFYLDTNNNGKFEVDQNEMVGCSNSGQNGFSTKHSFKIPENLKPGIYRLRGKVDWDSTDPAGNDGSSGSNYIISNGGGMIDVLLNVYDPSVTTVTVNNDQRNGDILLADGGKIENYTHQRLTSLKVKAQPENGFDYAGMIIRTGYNMAGDSLVHSNPQWTYKRINYTEFAEDDTYTIPAADFSADVRIEGLMVEKGTLPGPGPQPDEKATFPFVSPTPAGGKWVAGTKAYYIQNGAVEQAWISIDTDYTDGSGNLKLSNGVQPYTPEGMWVVCGNDEDGYQFYNLAAGTAQVLGLTGSDKAARCKMYPASTTDASVSTRFDYHANGSGFSFRIHGTTNNCLNSRDQFLALWDAAAAFTTDDGSRFTFALAEEAVGIATPVCGQSVISYDLQGRKQDASKLPAGIYLIEGKKRIVK